MEEERVFSLGGRNMVRKAGPAEIMSEWMGKRLEGI
jgi:hypothetical protein